MEPLGLCAYSGDCGLGFDGCLRVGASVAMG